MDKRLQKQIEKQMQTLHEGWMEAIQSTPGIGPILTKRIMEKREQIARRKLRG